MPPMSAHHGALPAFVMPVSPPLESDATRISTSVPIRNDTVAACRLPTWRPRRALTGACRPTKQPAATASSTASPRLMRPSRSSSLGLQPVAPDADVDGQRRVVLPDSDHLLLDQLGGRSRVLGGALEQQLVVNREDQARPLLGLRQGAMTAHHGELDDIGRGALDHRVDGQSFPERSHLVVAGPQLRNLAAAAPQRRHMAVLAGLLNRFGHEARHAGKALQVGVYELLRLLPRDVETI